jgi:predicted phage tail protein
MRKSKNKVEQTTKLLEGSKGGGGGGKGGQSEGAKEAPNTLQSKSTVRVVEALSEGPIGGFVNTQALLNSIYFDDTPVMGPNGSTNIPEVLMRANYGAHVQEVLIGFALAETEYGVGVTLDTTGTIRLINSGVDVVRVTVQFPNGLSQTDTKTGNTDGFGVGLEIYAYSDDGGSAFYYREVSGKTVRPYEEAWDIPRPTGNETTNWYIRVRRTSAPQGSSYIQDAVAWTRYTEIENDTSETATYPDVAHVGLEIDAKATGSQIPRRSYFLKGLLIKVPSNFTAMTVNDFGVITYGTYSGNWDGTFKPFLELCNDPVWICYDLLTNTRYGLGNEIDPNTIDKFSFYDAAKYNSQVITYQYLNNMGVPETIAEPRYTFNGPIQTQEQAFKVVQAVASTCRGSIYAGAGGITFLQDRPKESVGTITNASVVDGVFTYSGSELGERYTVVKVTFNDSTDRYLPNVIEYEDPVMIDRFGYNVSEVAAFGVTSPGQAFRMGKWIVETTCNQTESVQFTMSFNSAFFGIGEVVSIADNNYVTTDMGGIIDNVLVNGLNTDIYVDRVVLNSARVLQFIDKYTAKSVKVPILSMLPQTNGNTIVKISGTTTQPAVDTPYLAYDVIEPREWVITGVTENVGIYSYTGVAYDYTKFSRVETGVAANKTKANTQFLISLEQVQHRLNLLDPEFMMLVFSLLASAVLLPLKLKQVTQLLIPDSTLSVLFRI